MHDPLDLPDVSVAEATCGAFPWDWFLATLKKAQEVGITGTVHKTKWDKQFKDCFFQGANPLPKGSKWDEGYTEKAFLLFEAVGRSFRPRHQHKHAVCAYILKILEEGPGE